MEKKVKGVLLALVLMFVIISGFIPGMETAITVHAADDSGVCSSCVNIAWELDGTTLTISKVDGASSGNMCNDCNQQWYSNQVYIENIIIEDGVTSIGSEAFSSCSSLASITIPQSVTSISDYAFYGCGSLKNVTIPQNISSIENSTFEGCSSLTSVTIPVGVTSIGSGAFGGCDSLTDIIIPDGVTSIGNGAFCGCSSLKSIAIPERVTSIGKQVFEGCSSLTAIVIPKEVTDIGERAFKGCSGLKSITIPERVTSIEEQVFEGCGSLTDVTIPSGVKSIGSWAFKGCNNLTSITIPDGVTRIGRLAFYGCSSLKSVTIPKGVTSIEEQTFEGCSSLTRITIPDGVTSIESWAFRGCSSLTNITIPEGVISLGNSVFKECSSLNSVTIPESVINIEERAFEGCSSLTKVTIPEGVTSLESYVFNGCSSLKNIIIPDGVTNIGINVFEGCSGLTRVTIPESVTSIGTDAFWGCSSLTSIIIPDGVTSLGFSTFGNCTVLKTVTMPCILREQVSTYYVFANINPTISWNHLSANCTVDDITDSLSLECPTCDKNYIVTLKAPVQTTYTGKPIEATCTGTSDGFSPIITYSGNQLVDGKPILPGTYTATIGYDETTKVSIQYTITEVAAPAKPYKIENTIFGVNIFWTSTSDVSEYGLWRSETGVNGTYKWIENSTKTYYTDTKVESGKTYYYKLTTLDTVNNVHSAKSDAIGITVQEPKTSGVCSTCGNIAWEWNGTTLTISKATNAGTGDMCSKCYTNWEGDIAFAEDVIIKTGVTSIGNYAFDSCTKLETVKVSCSLKEQIVNNNVFNESNPAISYTHPIIICTANDTTDTLTAACACGQKAYTATLKAPSKTTYTGKAIVATCTNNIPDFTPVITYSGSNLVNGKPVKAGTYTATLTYGDKKVSLKYTITEATAPAKPNKITNVVSGVHVYWPAVSGVSKYGLWRSETGVNGTYKWIANPTVAHFTDTKVTSGKTYYYKVTTLDTVNNVHSAKSAAIGITYVATPDITKRENKAAGVVLSWNKISGATGYAIYRKPYSGNSDWVRVATINSPTTLTWTDTSVKSANGSIYKYTIRALAGSNNKTLSGCRGAGRTMVRLSSRTLSSATKATATSIKCSWNTTSQATGYEVRFMVGNTVYKTYTVNNYKTGVKTFTGLKAGQTYKIQVRSYKKVDGVGTFYSAWSTAKTVSL